MSFSEALESQYPLTVNKNWCNVSFNDVKCNSISGSPLIPTLSGPLTISANVASGSPILTVTPLNNASNNFNVGFQSGNQDNTAVIKLVTQNTPTPQTAIWSNGTFSISTFAPANPISFSPNNTFGLSVSYVTTGQSLTTMQQYTAVNQQYLETHLSANQTINDLTITTIIFDAVDRNIGGVNAISYNNTTGIATINVAGTYQISYTVSYHANADSNVRASQIVLGSGEQYGVSVGPNCATANCTQSSSASIYLTASSTVMITGFQHSTGALDVLANSRFIITKLS
jgi:hypothetical protein